MKPHLALILVLLGQDAPPLDPYVSIRSFDRRGRESVAGGVVIGDGFVLTTSNVVIDSVRVEMKGRRCAVAYFNWKSDLALLRVDTAGHRVARLASAPAVSRDRVRLAGSWDYGFGEGNVARCGEPGDPAYGFLVRTFAFEARGTHGKHWGGAVLNEEGELVGLVTRMRSRFWESDRVGQFRAVDLTEIRKFLARK